MSEESDEDKIFDLIEELCTTGETKLDDRHVSQLKELCKKSSSNISSAFLILFDHLQKDHAQIRYSCVLIVDRFFRCSHVFRMLLLNQLRDFFQLVVVNKKTCRPIHVDEKLKALTPRLCYEWHCLFGKSYRRLQLGYEFLKNVCRVDFERFAREERERAKERRLEELARKTKLNHLSKKLDEKSKLIEPTIKQLQECFCLLIPTVSEDSTSTNADDVMNKHSSVVGNTSGLVSHNYSLSINLSKKVKVRKTDENVDIVNNTRDLHNQLKHQSTRLERWCKSLVRYGTDESEVLLNQIKSLKVRISALLNKYDDLKFVSDDEDFEDVPEIDLESQQIERLRSEGTFSDTNTPSCSSANTLFENTQDSTTVVQSIYDGTLPDDNDGKSRREKLLKIAPVVEYDTDLNCWEGEIAESFATTSRESMHRFWTRSNDSRQENSHTKTHTRVMHFQSKMEPVKRMCNFPITDGKLCIRMDRYKCPFHGVIIDRDENTGEALNSQEREKDLKRRRDMEIKRENEEREKVAQSLGITRKKQKPMNVHQLRYGRLIDITKKNSKHSLQAKVLNPKAMRKANEINNEKVRKKHAEKFGSNFNYY